MLGLHQNPAINRKLAGVHLHVLGLEESLPSVSFHQNRGSTMEDPILHLGELPKIRTQSESAGIITSRETDYEITEDKSCYQKCCDLRQSESCRIEPKLLKFKAFFFFFGGAIGCVFPYLSIYFKQIGLSPNEIGLISGVRPLIGFCSGPLWGLLADRFRMRKLMLAFSALGWLSFMTSIGFVPPADFSNSTCPYVDEFMGVSHNLTGTNLTTPRPDESLRSHFISEHKLRSDITASESLLESRGWMYVTSGVSRVFYVIMVLAILGEIVQSPCGALADSGCIEEMGDMNKYGIQRVWGSLGLGLFSMITGGVISTTRDGVTICGVSVVISDYRVAFYFFAGCMSCCFITSLFFKFQKQADDHETSKPRPNPLKVIRMFCTWHYGSWLFCIFTTGVCNGVILGFLFWHLENLGATQFVLGVANAVSLFSESIMFLVIFRILKNTNVLVFMCIGLLGYTVRFGAYALIENPWSVLPFEILQGATFAGIWSVYVKYLCSNIPSEYLGTIQGIMHGVYWGLGSGSGHMIGGISVEMIGAKMTFWVFSIVSFVNIVVFMIIQKCTTRPNIFGKYEEMKDST